MSNIAKTLREIVGTSGVQSIICKVDKVTGRTCDVTPVDTDIAPIKDVRLNAQVDGNAGVVITPKVGSFVLVSLLTENDAFVSMFSEVDAIVMDGGKNGGLTITPELKTQLKKMSARIDGIIDSINDATVVATPQDGGKSLWGFFKAAISTNVTTKENFSKIENEKIKH